MRAFPIASVAALIALAAAQPVLALCASAKDMNGTWQATDGGTYRIRQVGSHIWWIGTSKDGGKSFTNVFSGTRTGNVVSGSWADIPAKGAGAGGNSGTLKLQVYGAPGVTGFKQLESTGSFSAKSWFKPCDDTVQNPVG